MCEREKGGAGWEGESCGVESLVPGMDEGRQGTELED